MTETIPQNNELIKNLKELLAAHEHLFGQKRVYERVVLLVFAEVMALARHTVTQLLLVLGLTERDWSAWYRLFSQRRFDEAGSAGVLVGETLKHVGAEEVYVVAGDGTQVPRVSHKMEGTSWLRNPLTPVFRPGIHRAQRWFHGSWLMPAENGYSRAMPLRFLPAFAEKAVLKAHGACKEWEAALVFVNWLRAVLTEQGRAGQRVLMLLDGSFDTVEMWKALPQPVIGLVRSAKNRVLYHLPTEAQRRDRRRKYGDLAPHPQNYLQHKQGWKSAALTIRGRERQLRYQVAGPFTRYGAPHVPLFLLIVGGQTYSSHGHTRYREPVYYLVNAQPVEAHWQLPLPIDTLLFWAWQRWEIEVAHRELKTSFGLGDKQCWNSHAAVLSVQWSAWVYSLCLLAGYRSWGLTHSPSVPTAWWRGAGRWSFTTLWRAFRADLWGHLQFQPLCSRSSPNSRLLAGVRTALDNAVFGAARP
jgi:hypothetical protein